MALMVYVLCWSFYLFRLLPAYAHVTNLWRALEVLADGSLFSFYEKMGTPAGIHTGFLCFKIFKVLDCLIKSIENSMGIHNIHHEN